MNKKIAAGIFIAVISIAALVLIIFSTGNLSVLGSDCDEQPLVLNGQTIKTFSEINALYGVNYEDSFYENEGLSQREVVYETVCEVSE